MHEWYSSGLMWITLNCFPQVEHRKSLRSEWRSMWSRSLSGLQKALSHSVQWKIFSEWKLLTCFLTCTTQMHDWLITRIFPCNQTLKWPYHFWFSFFPWKSTYQRFISLKKMSNLVFMYLALHHLLTNGSSAVNGCRQNECPKQLLKHHNNPQVIHTTPVHQLTSYEVKSCAFGINVAMFVILSESGEICTDQ